MQARQERTAKQLEREAKRRLPKLLAELLEDDGLRLFPSDRGADLTAEDSKGRQWCFEINSSNRPGQITAAAERLRDLAGANSIPVLVVPYMSSKGAEVAQRAEVNWLDLSGNAQIRDENLYVSVLGLPNQFATVGRPASPFAPRSARISRLLLLDPRRWWRQRDLVEATGLDDGSVSRIVRRLGDELLLERQGAQLRPRDPDLLLDAWAGDYRFDRHDSVLGHLTGGGMGLARAVASRLQKRGVEFAFTGLPAAWSIDGFANFRLNSVYVEGDPREIAEAIELREGAKGANVQLLAPDDAGVFAGRQEPAGLTSVSTVQVYLDLLALPERAAEAASHLRAHYLDWHAQTAEA